MEWNVAIVMSLRQVVRFVQVARFVNQLFYLSSLRERMVRLYVQAVIVTSLQHIETLIIDEHCLEHSIAMDSVMNMWSSYVDKRVLIL